MSIITKTNSSFVLVNNIDSANEKQKIKVQILVLWKANKNAAGISLEMVLVDEEGTRIHAQVEEDLSKPHQKFLKEGQAVIINAFQLKDYLGEFRTNPYPYKIGFFRTTKVKPADGFPETIPQKYFANFDQILSGQLDKNVLVDSDDEDQHHPRYNCEKCNDVYDIIHCFYLVLRVSDESAGETKFLLFNKTAEKLTGRYAWELVNEAAQEDASFMPQALTDLIGRKLLFKISIGPDNKQGSNSAYVVDLVVDDAAMIEEFEAQPIPQAPMHRWHSIR
uniref:DUF223 domain-containing protein n=2 Tax=Brassica TaxID=3705 RepID=A0A0D2ZRY2_BRAOL